MRTDLPELVAAGPVAPRWEFLAFHPDDLDPLPIDASRFRLVFDESVAPRCQLTIEAKAPADVSTRQLLDPRAPVRVHVRAGHTFAGVDDLETVARLGLRDRRIRYPGELMTIEAAGDEAIVLDGAVAGYFTSLSNATTTGAMTTILGQVLVSPIVNVTAAAGAAVALPNGSYLDRWATLENLADQIGDVDVFDDGMGVWWISPRATIAGSPDLTLTHGVDGTLIRTDEQLSRNGEWFNRVYLLYRWDDSGGVEQNVSVTRSITTGPQAAVLGNVRTYTEKRTTPATTTTAGNAAASLVRRLASKGRTTRVTAVAVPWLRPGHTLLLQLPSGVDELVLVSRVAFDESGSMEIDTRSAESGTVA